MSRHVHSKKGFDIKDIHETEPTLEVIAAGRIRKRLPAIFSIHYSPSEKPAKI